MSILSDSRSHRLFRSLDVTTVTTISSITPATVPVCHQDDRLTDSPSPPLHPSPFQRWLGSPAYSSPRASHTSLTLWPTTTWEEEKEALEEEATFSCDSLDPSQTFCAVAPTVRTSPSPPPSQSAPRKRWHSPAQQQESCDERTRQFPRFVCWELPAHNSVRRSSTSKPLVRVHPRMRSEIHPPTSHKCDLKAKAHHTPRSRLRLSSRDRNSSGSGQESMTDDSCSRPSRKSSSSKWTRSVSIQQLLPSKSRFSASSSMLSLNCSSETRSGRGTYQLGSHKTHQSLCMKNHFVKKKDAFVGQRHLLLCGVSPCPDEE